MIDGTRSALRSRRNWIAAAIAATTLSCTLAPAAQAGEAKVIGSGVSLAGSQGAQFNITGPGVLVVQAYDVGVAGTIAPPLDGLSFSVYNATSVFGAKSGEGELAMDISGPGMYFLNLNAIPSVQSKFQMGLVSWVATFESNAVVPLPASVWLLLAGLAWATGMQRRRAKLARADASECLHLYRNQSVTYAT